MLDKWNILLQTNDGIYWKTCRKMSICVNKSLVCNMYLLIKNICSKHCAIQCPQIRFRHKILGKRNSKINRQVFLKKVSPFFSLQKNMILWQNIACFLSLSLIARTGKQISSWNWKNRLTFSNMYVFQENLTL